MKVGQPTREPGEKMRIEGLSQMMVRSLMAALPKDAPAFPLAEGEGPVRPLPTGTAPMVPNVEMLVALAANTPSVERRRQMAERAAKGLDALERLHAELLSGTPSVEALQAVVEWSQSGETPDDPVLAQLLGDIDVRVRVELAKLDIEI